MKPILLPHLKREKIEYYHLGDEGLNHQNSFSDFQKSVISSHDAEDEEAWTASYASLDQSDGIRLDCWSLKKMKKSVRLLNSFFNWYSKVVEK